MASVKENLIAAKALIDTPAKWGKGCDRVCFCALDAASAIPDAYIGVRDALKLALPADFEPDQSNWNHDVAQFNDEPGTTHADIMALFDRAIAAQDEVA